MKKQLQKSAEPQSTEPVYERRATRMAAVSFNPAQPLLASARRSLPQPKHSLARKSSEHGMYCTDKFISIVLLY